MSDIKQQELFDAAKALLDFVRNRYPDDFKVDKDNFKCPFHIALNKAVLNLSGETNG